MCKQIGLLIAQQANDVSLAVYMGSSAKPINSMSSIENTCIISCTIIKIVALLQAQHDVKHKVKYTLKTTNKICHMFTYTIPVVAVQHRFASVITLITQLYIPSFINICSWCLAISINLAISFYNSLYYAQPMNTLVSWCKVCLLKLKLTKKSDWVQHGKVIR